jgi:hypothetical protein
MLCAGFVSVASVPAFAGDPSVLVVLLLLHSRLLAILMLLEVVLLL